jgi:predicted RNA-binding protein with PIN domain
MPVIIDGYNLLRAIENLGLGDITDVKMCHVISHYLKSKDDRGVVVFDGIGPRDKSGFNFSNLKIIFSGADTEADSIIEREIAESSAPKRLIVVSSDRRIRFAAKKRNAPDVKSDIFWHQVIQFLAMQTRARGRTEPREKFNGISEAETEQWLKVFGFTP